MLLYNSEYAMNLKRTMFIVVPFGCFVVTFLSLLSFNVVYSIVWLLFYSCYISCTNSFHKSGRLLARLVDLVCS